MADKDKVTEKDKQEVRSTEQQTVFPTSAAEEPGLPPNVGDPSAGLHEERGLKPPYAGDGTNVGMTHPRIDDEPGVTGIDRGSDPSVPSFIPDLVGPRTPADEAAAVTADDRAAAAEATAKDAKAQNAAATKAAKAARAKK